MEALSLLLDIVIEGGYISGFRFMGKNGTMEYISDLLFTHDIIIFYKDSKNQLSYLGWVLAWSEALSNLQINVDRSVILSVGRVETGERLATELGCNLGSLLMDYLGFL